MVFDIEKVFWHCIYKITAEQKQIGKGGKKKVGPILNDHIKSVWIGSYPVLIQSDLNQILIQKEHPKDLDRIFKSKY